MAKIGLIITGGIAGYKSLYLIRLLRDKGYEVYPIMTKSACEFITPLSVSTLSGNDVYMKMFDLDGESEIGHINYSRKLDLLMVVPCTANFIAKMANGMADDLASTVVLASSKPVVIAPAMNPQMWDNPATKENIKTLVGRQVKIIEPESGDMACGENGVGRMAEPETIAKYIFNSVDSNETNITKGKLVNKHFLITVGGTTEHIDPVRVITNKSSGKQGFAIAQNLVNQGAKVSIIKANTTAEIPSGVNIIPVESADEMLNETNNVLKDNNIDCAIFCSAVADYKVKTPPLDKKHKKDDGEMNLQFVENPDILATVCAGKDKPELVIGFNADTDNLVENGKKKLFKKKCNVIISNLIDKQIFGGNKTNAFIITKDNVQDLGEISKIELADIIVQKIVNQEW